MKFFIVLIWLSVCFQTLTYSQSYYSPYLRISTASTASGNSSQIGGGLDINATLATNIKLDADISVVKESKIYVGNGTSYRSQAELGYKVINNVWVLAGGAASLHSNSSYNKPQYQPLLSVHYIYKDTVDVYYTKLFKAYGNINEVKGNRFGYRTYVSGLSTKLPLFVQAELNSISFKDSYSFNHKDVYLIFGVGFSIKK